MSSCSRFRQLCCSSDEQTEMGRELLGEKKQLPLSSVKDSCPPISPSAYTPPGLEILSLDQLLAQSQREMLPVAACQDHPHAHSKHHFSEHITHMGVLQVFVSSGELPTWEGCDATLADGILSLNSAASSRLSHHERIDLANVTLDTVDSSLGQFSLIPVQTGTGRARGSDIGADSDPVLLSASPDSYPQWLQSLEDAIRGCHVKSLLSGGKRSHRAVQWYKQQFDKYERAMNTIEFGSAFTLHSLTTGGAGVSGDDCRLQVWLQAEEDDEGLVLFPAGEDGEGPLRTPPPSAAGRKKSVSNAVRLFDCPGGGSEAERDACAPALQLEGGLHLPFHLILGVVKGTTATELNLNSTGAFFTISTAERVYVLEASSRPKRDQWAVAVADVVQFSHVPNPNTAANGD